MTAMEGEVEDVQIYDSYRRRTCRDMTAMERGRGKDVQRYDSYRRRTCRDMTAMEGKVEDVQRYDSYRKRTCRECIADISRKMKLRKDSGVWINGIFTNSCKN
jgi:hypothetical protein